MALLSQLTLKQRARMTEWRAEWLQIASSTAPADRPRAEHTITQLLALVGQPAPLFVWCDSPATGLMLMHTLRELAPSFDSMSPDRLLGPCPWTWPDRLPLSSWWPQSLRSSLESSLCSSLESLGWPLDQSRRALVSSVAWPLPLEESRTLLQSSLNAAVEPQLTASVRSTLNRSLEWYLRSCLTQSSNGLGLTLQLWLKYTFQTIIGAPGMPDLYGPHLDQANVSWICLHTFCRDVLGLKYAAETSHQLDLWADLRRSCGWCWSFRGLCVLCERPDRVEWDLGANPPRLHSETGPALRFRDGLGLYLVQGTRVPPHIVEDRSSITVQRIDEERNNELRRIMVDLYGRGRFLRDAGATVVHRDRFGTLWGRSFRRRPLLMVEVTNATPEPDGSFRVFFLSVHPELRPMLDGGALGDPQELTAHNAVASTFGLRGEEYWPACET